MQNLPKRTIDNINYLVTKKFLFPSPGKRGRLIDWLVLSAAIGGSFFLIRSILDFNLRADAAIQDTRYASPDGAYTAAVREVDTGAVGSCSVVLLESGNRQFPKKENEDSVIAESAVGTFGTLTWRGPRTLQITYGNEPPSDWETRWRDVTILYR